MWDYQVYGPDDGVQTPIALWFWEQMTSEDVKAFAKAMDN